MIVRKEGILKGLLDSGSNKVSHCKYAREMWDMIHSIYGVDNNEAQEKYKKPCLSSSEPVPIDAIVGNNKRRGNNMKASHRKDGQRIEEVSPKEEVVDHHSNDDEEEDFNKRPGRLKGMILF